jgi:hypothetical protein
MQINVDPISLQKYCVPGTHQGQLDWPIRIRTRIRLVIRIFTDVKQTLYATTAQSLLP